MISNIPVWGQADIGLLGKPAPIKLLLKVKDEPLLTADWIEHHARIVGYSNLAVFDNGSTSSEMDLVVRQYRGRVPFFRYGGFHNNLHNTKIFGDLYRVLEQCCSYHAALDADERLVWLEEGRWLADERITAHVLRRAQGQSVVGVWAQNILGHIDKFWVSYSDLNQGVAWGKPLVSTAITPKGILLHNSEAVAAGAEDSGLRNLFVLHLSIVSPQQRMMANLRKLRSYRVVPDDRKVEEAVQMDSASVENDRLRQYLDETKRLYARPPGYREPVENNPRVMTLLEDGSIGFADDAQRDLLAGFLRRPDPAA